MAKDAKKSAEELEVEAMQAAAETPEVEVKEEKATAKAGKRS